MATLQTPRLRLRPLAGGDAEAFAEVCGDAEVMRHIGDGVARTPEACVRTLERMERQWAEQGYGWWGLFEAGRLVGAVGYRAEPWLGEPEIGWMLRADAWGRGLAREGGLAALAYGFDTLGFRVVNALVRPANVASQRLAERLGFAHLGTVEAAGVAQEWYTRRAP